MDTSFELQTWIYNCQRDISLWLSKGISKPPYLNETLDLPVNLTFPPFSLHSQLYLSYLNGSLLFGHSLHQIHREILLAHPQYIFKIRPLLTLPLYHLDLRPQHILPRLLNSCLSCVLALSLSTYSLFSNQQPEGSCSKIGWFLLPQLETPQ